jgi:uncharacterized DUF497 family protein
MVSEAAMRIDNLIWLPQIIDKLADKHQVTEREVEQIFENAPRFRFVSKGRRRRNENLYAAYGQTDGGRYLIVFFILKPGHLALIVSARDMDRGERRQYGKK